MWRPVGDVLSESFRADLRCGHGDAGRLASLARERVPQIVQAEDDSDEDLVLRLQDARILGSFAESLLADRHLAESTRGALVERVFDLLPLPRSEGEVFLVESRAPPHLLALARYLHQTDSMTVLHVMHLVYAVFLDRSLLRNVPRATRSAVLEAVVRGSDASEGLRLLYSALHLAAVPKGEARSEFRRILRSRVVPPNLRRSLARLAASEDGGVADLAQVAQAEGLLPGELADAEAPAVLVNIPRMLPALAPSARRFLGRSVD